MAQYKEDTRTEEETKEPSLYKVILHNDDYTSMEFVVEVLKKVFHKRDDEAEEIMWRVHRKGRAMCGIYIHEIAMTKAEQVKVLARQNHFPLLATVEADE
jgi:ATP-dependent Clp protease adaptor protein ClpS